LCEQCWCSDTHPQIGEYSLSFFDGPTLQQERAIQMGAAHPLSISSATKKERMIGRVSANPEIFRSNGQTGEPYFEQYVSHIIPAQCKTGYVGYVVFTTTQEEQLSSDTLETLDLIASVVSTFYARWSDTQQLQLLMTHNQQLRAELASQHAGAGETVGGAETVTDAIVLPQRTVTPVATPET
jgi:hypothetical protein